MRELVGDMPQGVTRYRQHTCRRAPRNTSRPRCRGRSPEYGRAPGPMRANDRATVRCFSVRLPPTWSLWWWVFRITVRFQAFAASTSRTASARPVDRRRCTGDRFMDQIDVIVAQSRNLLDLKHRISLALAEILGNVVTGKANLAGNPVGVADP